MYFLIADEAQNQKNDATKFFIFGAVIVEHSATSKLTIGIEKIRDKYDFKPTDSLKFSPSDKPKQVSTEQFIEAKKEVLKLARKHSVHFLGYAMLHAIGRNRTNEELITWGADGVLTKFQQYLTEHDDERGFAFFDRLPIPHPEKYLRATFQNRLEHAVEGHRLQNIDMICSVTDGCSHLTSLCDICTGSFRYVVNEPERSIAGKELIKLLKPLFWGEAREGKKHSLERGLLLRPIDVQHDSYRADYEELKARIFNWANEDQTN
jgi:hypothetical protein